MRFEKGPKIQGVCTKDSLNAEGQTTNNWNLCFILQILYASCPSVILAQSTVKICAVAWNREKTLKTRFLDFKVD